MKSPRAISSRRPGVRRRAAWAALVVAGGLVPGVGCQVEYAGMTLPSGKYMHDDVQYFPPGPDFPWANTNAATQRARMRAMGMDVSAIPVPGADGPVGTPPIAEGALDPTQNRPGAPTNVNTLLVPPGGEIVTPPPAPGVAPPAPGGPDAPGPMLPGGVGVPTTGPGY